MAHDLVNAILKTTANKFNRAEYWSRDEQERRLIEVYEKWFNDGTVWTAAAEKVSCKSAREPEKLE